MSLLEYHLLGVERHDKMHLNKPFSLLFLLSIKQHKLEGSLLALGQFQHALAELMAWLTHTEELLDSQRPINGDPKVIEVELAKHHVSARGVCTWSPLAGMLSQKRILL